MTITLATLGQATAQEVFDQVAAHLIRQGRSSLLDGQCQYRANGLKCAAGCLIADDEYHPNFEKKPWPKLVSEEITPRSHMDLIHALQDLHDDRIPRSWPDGLLAIAKQFNLEWRFEEESKPLYQSNEQ